MTDAEKIAALVEFVESIAGPVWDDPADQERADNARALLASLKEST